MTNRFNGWTRLWIVSAGITSLSIAHTSIKEFNNPKPSKHLTSGTYVLYGLPRFTRFSENKVIFSDGREFIINQKDPITGSAPKPWDIDWLKEPQIPKTRYISWESIIITLLISPTLFLIFAWIAFKATTWVIAGFKQQGRT